MSISPDLLSLTVLHAGQSIRVELTKSGSVAELRQVLEKRLSIPAAGQKIIYKGRALPVDGSEAEQVLSALGIVDTAKISVIGSRVDSIKALQDQGAALQRRLGIAASRQSVQPRKTATAGKTVVDLNHLASSGAAAFGRIEVLQGCPHESLRKERLEKLSKDEAVLDCMKRRSWTVGLLTELHPHRDPTLLGLNRNAGQSVELRLMTDDLSGLRSYNSTRMVLLHELTHNKYGDHDENFKTLNSMLNKEVTAFEEAKSAGAHRLGGEVGEAYEVDEREVEQMCGSAKAGHGPKSSVSSRKPKTPVSQEEGAWELEQRRQAILQAAQRRQNQQQQ